MGLKTLIAGMYEKSAANGGTIGGTTGTTDNAITRADGTGGSTLQGSLVTIDDNGNLFTGRSAAIADGWFCQWGTSANQTGIYGNVGTTLGFRVNTSDVMVMTSAGLSITGSLTLGADAILLRAAANTLALRNGVNAQTVIVTNTWANTGSDKEEGIFDWITTANVLTIGTRAAGTGVLRAVNLVGSALQINGAAGATATLTAITGITVTKGIVTAITGT